ncbi:MAG: hypothetical protein F7B17_00815 [Desulfurococcales archaeon]|nr:hypothetical protein [Desulfurococcales archaeon]
MVFTRGSRIVDSIFDRLGGSSKEGRGYELGVTTYIRSLSCPYCGWIGDALLVSRVVFKRIPRFGLNENDIDKAVLGSYAVNKVSCSSCGGEFYVLSSALRSREEGKFLDIDVKIVKNDSPLASLLEKERPFSGIIMDGALVFKYPELIYYENYDAFMDHLGNAKPAFISLKVSEKREESRASTRQPTETLNSSYTFNLESQR